MHERADVNILPGRRSEPAAPVVAAERLQLPQAQRAVTHGVKPACPSASAADMTLRAPLLLVVVLWLVAPMASASGSAPSAVIDGLHAALLDAMQRAAELGVDGRYRALEPVLREAYDFEQMTALAAGTAWGGADAPQRRDLVAAFTHFSIATYAARFDGYAGERFEVIGERPAPREAVIVDTHLVRPEGEPVGLSYVMRSRAGRWRIVDVLLDQAISELAVRRSEYAAILAEGGVARLARVLNDRADAMLRPTAR